MSDGKCPSCREVVWERQESCAEEYATATDTSIAEPAHPVRSGEPIPAEDKSRTLDVILFALLAVTYVPLSLWGGREHWAGATDLLPILMLAIGAGYVTDIPGTQY